MLMSDSGQLFDFVLIEPPRREYRCLSCRDTGLVKVSEPVAAPAQIGERAPTARDALQVGAWLLNCRLCECTRPLHA
jgi:hypothetical protein